MSMTSIIVFFCCLDTKTRLLISNKAFSKYYYRHLELSMSYNVRQHQCISEPVFYVVLQNIPLYNNEIIFNCDIFFLFFNVKIHCKEGGGS